MSFSLVPDYIFKTFDCATPEFLLSLGVKGIILDIDNTLEPYEHPLPGDHVINWLASLNEAGIKASIVSNNGRKRVELFNSKLSLPAYYKAKKPFKRNLLRAMKDMGTSREDTVLMGDQVFTDVWAAHNTGLRAILVLPINDTRDPFTKFKRMLERPIIKKYEKRNKK